jgi:hypothetical protein
MRYIDINNLVLPDGWQAKATALHADLVAAADAAARSKILKENPIWQELFIPLQNLSKGKCWYSEAREIMSDKDVDHFRPKNEARNLDGAERDGYWWLAYDSVNYRFSSIYSNRRRQDKYDDIKEAGGKWSYFPLFPNSPVAATKARLQDEDIMLLDPTDEDDTFLLTFDDSGEAIPNTVAAKDIARVKASINLYHLDHTPLKEERQKVWDKCQRFINEIQEINSLPDISISDKARIIFLKREIKKMIDFDEELSAVAIACVEHNKLSRMLRA